MKTPDTILTTPGIEKSILLVRECVSLGCLGAISGVPGTGKTVALRAIESRYHTLNLPGNCTYHRCCATAGPTRGIKDMLDSLGLRHGLLPGTSTLQLTVRVAQRELATRQIRVLLLDEADAWDVPSLQGLIALYDATLSAGQPVSIIFSGSVHVVKWLDKYTAAISRTLRCEEFSNLSIALSVSILQQWADPFCQFAESYNAQKIEALKAVKIIHKATGGNLRRLNYFAKLFLLEHQEVTPESVTQTLSKMIVENK